MEHSVAKHLGFALAEYDAGIRRLVPGYDAMLDEICGALDEHAAPSAHILDVGTGSGRMAERMAARLPSARLTLIDLDPAALDLARTRLAACAARVQLVHGSFTDVLPTADVAVASLSLHHLREREERIAAHRRIFDALPPSGVLVLADAMVPAAAALATPLMARWAAHLVANGDTLEEAHARFAAWAKEERYFSVEEELAMLRAAGWSEIEVRWRHSVVAVLVARKAPETATSR